MVERSRGKRSNTRWKMTRKLREKGKILITRHLQSFKEGDMVLIKPDSSVQKGLPSRRFYLKAGKIKGVRGKSYLIEIKDGGKTKRITTPPVHLKKL